MLERISPELNMNKDVFFEDAEEFPAIEIDTPFLTPVTETTPKSNLWRIRQPRFTRGLPSSANDQTKNLGRPFLRTKPSAVKVYHEWLGKGEAKIFDDRNRGFFKLLN